MFGTPPLGTQFLGTNQQSGLDWPVRMLVYLEKPGQVMIAWSDFAWVGEAARHRRARSAVHHGNEVAASIASPAAKK